MPPLFCVFSPDLCPKHKTCLPNFLLLLLLLSRFSHVRLCATPWTAAYQAPPSMGFSRQEYWSGVPLPSRQLSLEPLQFKVNMSKLNSSYPPPPHQTCSLKHSCVPFLSKQHHLSPTCSCKKFRSHGWFFSPLYSLGHQNLSISSP